MPVYTETPEAIEILKPKIQRPSSKEELGALLEGDVLIDNKVGNLVYTEQYGEPRLIRQLNPCEMLSVHIKEGKRHKYEVLADGSIDIQTGDKISIYHNWDWMQYDLDQSILAEAGFYGQRALAEAQAKKY